MYKFLLFVSLAFWASGNSSLAQINWIKPFDAPVLERDTVLFPPSLDLIAQSDAAVVFYQNEYKMWYTCGGGNFPTDDELGARICFCSSSNGISWTKHPTPVLDRNYGNGWDSLAVETATVLIDESAPATERYKMWYAGQINEPRYDIGYATSPDGIEWTKHPNAVLQIGLATEWDASFLEGPSVVKDADGYKMWYAGADLEFNGSPTDGQVNIGLATSQDGIFWEKHPSNPILTVAENSWESVYIQDPEVVLHGGTYHMWYGGVDQFDNYGQQIGYASSPDGIVWSKSAENPVLEKGLDGDWDANTASFPGIVLHNDTLKMWYTGKDVDPIPEGSLNYYWNIGYAFATDFKTGIEANVNTPKSNIFPIPASDQLTVQTKQAFVIRNILGTVIYTGKGTTKISVANWQKGVYCWSSATGSRLFIVE